MLEESSLTPLTASEERPGFYFRIPGKGLCTCPANFSATGQSLTVYLFFGSQWAVLWHDTIANVGVVKRKKQYSAVSLGFTLLHAGVCRAGSPAAACLTEPPASLQLLDPSQQSGDGQSPFILLSPPHSLTILDPHFPQWAFLPCVKMQFIVFLC